MSDLDFQLDLPHDWARHWVAPELRGLDSDDEDYFDIEDSLQDIRWSERESLESLAPDYLEQQGGTVWCWPEAGDLEVWTGMRLKGSTVLTGDHVKFVDCDFEDVLFLCPAGSYAGSYYAQTFERCSFTGTVRFAMEDADGSVFHYFYKSRFHSAEIEGSGLSSGMDLDHPRELVPFIEGGAGTKWTTSYPTYNFTDCIFEVVSTKGVSESRVKSPVAWLHHA